MMKKTYPTDETTSLPEQVWISEDDKNENFRLHSRVDILFILKDLKQSDSLVTLYFGQENSFILTLMDLSTHYPMAIPLKDHKATTVCTALIEIFSNFGFPSEI